MIAARSALDFAVTFIRPPLGSSDILRIRRSSNDSGAVAVNKVFVAQSPSFFGSIINISPVASTSAPPMELVCSATKAAVDAITKSLAKELGPRNIRDNAINLGMVDSGGRTCRRHCAVLAARPSQANELGQRAFLYVPAMPALPCEPKTVHAAQRALSRLTNWFAEVTFSKRTKALIAETHPHDAFGQVSLGRRWRQAVDRGALRAALHLERCRWARQRFNDVRPNGGAIRSPRTIFRRRRFSCRSRTMGSLIPIRCQVARTNRRCPS
jgi:hypothetical protein